MMSLEHLEGSPLRATERLTESHIPSSRRTRPAGKSFVGTRWQYTLAAEREEEVLSLVTEGKNNKEIARRLYLSVKTVRNHVYNILFGL